MLAIHLETENNERLSINQKLSLISTCTCISWPFLVNLDKISIIIHLIYSHKNIDKQQNSNQLITA